jgi:hypothetical protein
VLCCGPVSWERSNPIAFRQASTICLCLCQSGERIGFAHKLRSRASLSRCHAVREFPSKSSSTSSSRHRLTRPRHTSKNLSFTQIYAYALSGPGGFDHPEMLCGVLLDNSKSGGILAKLSRIVRGLQLKFTHLLRAIRRTA